MSNFKEFVFVPVPLRRAGDERRTVKDREALIANKKRIPKEFRK